MKRFILSLVLGLALGGFSATDAAAQGGGLNIGVVDMQECLNQYYKTKIEVEGVNAIAKEKQKEIDSKRGDYEALTTRAASLDEKARDTSLSAEQRQAAFNELQGIMQERMAKGREISEAERRAQQEIIEARQKMEQTLVASIRELVNAKSAAKGLDLVYDKSFLPKANKVILFTSEKVPDITAEIIAELNKDAPATN
ncbi:MAG: OmpH family outer membrane protein [Verrucomicrobiae bacterium]|nr:OmpH family outer membrane protein [Verrucomicrobiae bacterium]